MKIIAHRANDGVNKENSLKAILNSLSKPYIDGVEIDIRLTKDNKFIINHDSLYKGYFIAFTNSQTLKKLGLDTLDDTLKQIKTNKIIMIEVKTDNNYIKLSKLLSKLLFKFKLNIYLCSFNYDFINYFQNNYNIKCGLIISPNINKKNIINNFYFNSISKHYTGKIPFKATFIWTVNSPKWLKNYNIITDKPLEMSKYVKQIF